MKLQTFHRCQSMDSVLHSPKQWEWPAWKIDDRGDLPLCTRARVNSCNQPPLIMKGPSMLRQHRRMLPREYCSRHEDLRCWASEKRPNLPTLVGAPPGRGRQMLS